MYGLVDTCTRFIGGLRRAFLLSPELDFVDEGLPVGKKVCTDCCGSTTVHEYRWMNYGKTINFLALSMV